MTTKTKVLWTDDMIGCLEEYIGVFSYNEIADHLGIPSTCVAMKVIHLGLVQGSDDGQPIPNKAAWFPTFENVTKKEARAICADAPKSAPFRIQRTQPFSEIGCSAAMCA